MPSLCFRECIIFFKKCSFFSNLFDTLVFEFLDSLNFLMVPLGLNNPGPALQNLLFNCNSVNCYRHVGFIIIVFFHRCIRQKQKMEQLITTHRHSKNKIHSTTVVARVEQITTTTIQTIMVHHNLLQFNMRFKLKKW